MKVLLKWKEWLWFQIDTLMWKLKLRMYWFAMGKQLTKYPVGTIFTFQQEDFVVLGVTPKLYHIMRLRDSYTDWDMEEKEIDDGATNIRLPLGIAGYPVEAIRKVQPNFEEFVIDHSKYIAFVFYQETLYSYQMAEDKLPVLIKGVPLSRQEWDLNSKGTFKYQNIRYRTALELNPILQ